MGKFLLSRRLLRILSDAAIIEAKIMNILITEELEGSISRATLIALVIT
jgi:hypothetical protein